MTLEELYQLRFTFQDRVNGKLRTLVKEVFAHDASRKVRYNDEIYVGERLSSCVFDSMYLPEDCELVTARHHPVSEICRLFAVVDPDYVRRPEKPWNFAVPFENLNTLDELIACTWALYRLHGGAP